MPSHLACVAIEFVQAAAISYPEPSFPIFGRKVYIICANACRISGIMDIAGCLTRNGVKPVKASACCQPQLAEMIVSDTVDWSRKNIWNVSVDAIVNKGFGDSARTYREIGHNPPIACPERSTKRLRMYTQLKLSGCPG